MRNYNMKLNLDYLNSLKVNIVWILKKTEITRGLYVLIRA